MLNENEIPLFIQKKIDEIYKHQMATKRLARQVESHFIKAYPQIDEPNLDGWTWRMHVDAQGQVLEPRESLNLLLKALNKEVFDVKVNP